MILSLQGCMAVGKTTAARYLEQHCQQVQVCFEDNAGNMLEVTHIVVGANASSILGVDTEDAEVEYFKIHNSEAMAISKNLDHTIFWTEDNCYYLLSGTIPMEELKQVALGLEPIS